jgi:hypothetical protein
VSARPTAAQILRRIEALEKARGAEAAVFELGTILFERQLPFGLETARQVTAVCTRRAGKSYACAAKLIDVARRKAGCVALYITLSRINAKRLVWGIVKELAEKHKIGAKVSEADLCLELTNGSRIYLSGAADESEVEKFRGLALGVVIVDEAQSFPAYLQKLVDEVLAPALMDFAGQLFLVGTPGPVPVGYFHDCSISAAWAHHAWSVVDNPWIQRKSGLSPQVLLEQELARRGVTVEDASIQREWFGRWVLDVNALVFRFESARNGRPKPPRECQHFVLGVDLGFDDADALAVLGWRDDSPEIDLVEEWVGAKQSITALMGRVKAAYDKYQPLAVVADTGGLGKKIADEVTQRTGVPIEAAEKERKLEHIEFLNDAMRTSRFFAPANSRFADDCMRVEWDRSRPEKPKISERFHSDIADAVLYAWRKALAWTYVEPKAPAPKLNTPEWFEQQQQQATQELEDEMEREFEANRQQKAEQAELEGWL